MSGFARCALVVGVVGVLLIGHPRTCVAQQKVMTGAGNEARYQYDTSGICLEGTLVERKVYGPPGYGETPAKDARATILVLKLSYPISVEPAVNTDASKTANLDSAKNVREVQLFVSQSRTADVRKLVGRMVTASGTLKESITASQYTKVWMDAKTVEPK